MNFCISLRKYILLLGRGSVILAGGALAPTPLGSLTTGGRKPGSLASYAKLDVLLSELSVSHLLRRHVGSPYVSL
jgi:hypothetical protein